MKTKQATAPKENLSSLLRKLRPMLPGEVVKHTTHSTPVGYLIDGKVHIHFDYYCNWNYSAAERSKSEEQRSKECIPSSVKVSVHDPYVKKALGKGEYDTTNHNISPRTYRRRVSSNDYNLEAIAACVTTLCRRIEERITQIKDYETKRKKEEDQSKLLTTKLIAHLSALGLKDLKNFHRNGPIETPSEKVSVHWHKSDVDSDHFDLTPMPSRIEALTFDLSLSKLTFSQLNSLIKEIISYDL